MLEKMKLDYRRSTSKDWSYVNLIKLCVASKGVAAVVNYRISNWLYLNKMKPFALMLKNRNIRKHGCDIGYETCIDGGFAIGHPVGIVISGDAIIGSNCTIMSCVTIGSRSINDGSAPRILDNVYIGTGSKILGAIVIESGSTIGANAVVLNNIESNCVVGGVPARLLRTDESVSVKK